MKKLMIMAVVMGLGLAAQAIDASFSYTDSSRYGYTLYVVLSDMSSGGDTSSTIYYLFDQRKTTDALSALSGAALTSATAAYDSKTVEVTPFNVDGNTLSWENDMSEQIYDLYMITSDQSYWKYGELTQYYESDWRGNQTLSDSDINTSDFNSEGAINGWMRLTEDVPEPTSGLLLILGLSGLALRRRRA